MGPTLIEVEGRAQRDPASADLLAAVAAAAPTRAPGCWP
jgi:hypothetical protein